MTRLLSLEDLDLATLRGVPVLVRVDFNVPLKEGRVTDDTRLVEALPTLRELTAAGARLLLCSHCGRPKGERNPKYSLRPAADRLAELLGRPVAFADDCIGEPAAAAAAALGDGDLVLLENLRYHKGEEKNEPEFAAALAANAKAYVDDAFGSAHRAHASITGVLPHLPRKAAGRLLVREVEALARLLGTPERPFAALLGGAKIEGKIDTLENLLPRLDLLLVGGGMANTFLAAAGHDLKASLVETERLGLAKAILESAAERGIEVLLPTDLVVTDSFEAPTRHETVAADAVPDGMLAVDIGPATREAFAAAVGRARTLFWNGPLGVFEKPPFDAGTRALAAALAACPGFTVIGGGETVAAARQAGVAERLGHVSTGGGASLEFLAGRELPGVAALVKG
ncbi:MAG: phosphoglycerate kinase [Acidobacteria bacterium]|jgi:phosphoglycerate kinase|nr:phosphoglycerate kinase [Thermoanaerobaculia bacterium]MDI9631130.1 phosphoglycerate kinase [Acidobacteriota bacterium]OQC40958.1 MAG: Phosphoglycerate kinase [Acidobacteria bacterium ADurb.Bin051]MBP7812433.1 phosphoglycerate kinase [Thermoanaerobaculia bacterium]MBP8844397.1 phosphoglycerate kinase [Thermoanaerobaculia bacterium]